MKKIIKDVVFKIKHDIASAELNEIRHNIKCDKRVKGLKKELKLAEAGDKLTLDTWKDLYI